MAQALKDLEQPLMMVLWWSDDALDHVHNPAQDDFVGVMVGVSGFHLLDGRDVLAVRASRLSKGQLIECRRCRRCWWHCLAFPCTKETQSSMQMLWCHGRWNFEQVDCRGVVAHFVEESVDCGGPEVVVPKASLWLQCQWWEKAVMAVLEAVLKPHSQAGVLEGGGCSTHLPGQQWFLFLHRKLEDF